MPTESRAESVARELERHAQGVETWVVQSSSGAWLCWWARRDHPDAERLAREWLAERTNPHYDNYVVAMHDVVDARVNSEREAATLIREQAQANALLTEERDRLAARVAELEGKREIGAVLAYDCTRTRGISGQVIGADGSGQWVYLIKGDADSAEAWAVQHLREMEANGFRIHCAVIAMNDEHGHFLGNPVRVVVANGGGDG